MTKDEAAMEANNRWGNRSSWGFADHFGSLCRVGTSDGTVRFIKGVGATFTAAFERAEKKRPTRTPAG